MKWAGQDLPVVTLRPGREKPLVQRHPWVFSGAIGDVESGLENGRLVVVADSGGKPMACGYYNSRSQIRVRVLTFDDTERVDADLLRRRFRKAMEGRRRLIADEMTNAYRLINAESDLLPGLVVDRYGDWVVSQFLTLGIEAFRSELLSIIEEELGPAGIYDRSDVDVRRKEGLREESGVACGQEPPDTVEIRENGLRFVVNIKRGQKTGFYLDQRDNRVRVAAYARGREVLNCFSYSGGFGVYAAAQGAGRIVNVDTSAEALEMATRNMHLNGVVAAHEPIQADVFHLLRQFREGGRRFDLIVLDPPKFAASAAQVEGATRGYKDINLLAMQLLRPAGVLATFSCSGLVTPDLFQKVVFGASVDAHRDVQILEHLSQAPDHPILLSFPESEYLKGLICRVL
jgi:23S rRNA (cytosine1962-C5)-methyltransferase